MPTTYPSNCPWCEKQIDGGPMGKAHLCSRECATYYDRMGGKKPKWVKEFIKERNKHATKSPGWPVPKINYPPNLFGGNQFPPLREEYIQNPDISWEEVKNKELPEHQDPLELPDLYSNETTRNTELSPLKPSKPSGDTAAKNNKKGGTRKKKNIKIEKNP